MIHKNDIKYILYYLQMDGEQQYLHMLREIVENGHYRKTRNGNTFSLFGKNLVFDLHHQGFPLLTTKKMFLRGIFEELKFFLLGKTDSSWLEDKGVHIWKGNTSREFLDNNGLEHYKEGDMGPMYFYQIFHFNHPYEGCHVDYTGKGLNQLQEVIHLLQTDRFSRRIILTTFNPLQVKEGVLFPCHGLVIQFYCDRENELCCSVYCRSQDVLLGTPFNIASYSLLLIILCEYINHSSALVGEKFIVGRLHMNLGDCHIYEQHIEASKLQLERTPFSFPQLKINKTFTTFDELEFSDLELVNYKCHPAIKAQMIA